MPMVYLITNKKNGGRYVGFTRRTIAYRWYMHCHAAKKKTGNMLISKAIRKYGKDSFEISVLGEFSGVQDALNAEMTYIAELCPEYNISAGGVGPTGIKWTKERRAKFTVSARKSWTPERKAHHSSIFSGRKLKPEQVEAMRLMDKSYQFKSVVCLNDGLFFGSIKEAAKQYGISARGIGEMLHGRQGKCGGFSFAYASAPISNTKRRSLLLAISHRSVAAMSRRKSRPVVCLSDDTVYQNGVSAAQVYKISPSRVMQLCQTGKISGAGLVFEYADLMEAA